MSEKFHMKLDQSGTAICRASIKSCPNGKFGHFSSPHEVLIAYGESIGNGEVPGLSTIVSIKNKEIMESRLDIAKETHQAATDDEYITAVEYNLHPLDGSEQKKLLDLHNSDSYKDTMIRYNIAKNSQIPAVLDQIVESEKDMSVLNEIATNKSFSNRDLMYEALDRINAESDQKSTAKRFMQQKEHEANIAAREDREFLRREAIRQKREAEKKEKTNQRQPQTTSSEPTANQPVEIGGRTLKNVLHVMTDLGENFESNFMPLDRKFRSLSFNIAKSSENETNPLKAAQMKELSDNLSKRSYKRAFAGVINGKKALETASVSFEKEIPSSHQNFIKQKITEHFNSTNTPVEVTFKGRDAIMRFISQDEYKMLTENREVNIV